MALSTTSVQMKKDHSNAKTILKFTSGSVMIIKEKLSGSHMTATKVQRHAKLSLHTAFQRLLCTRIFNTWHYSAH